jgi:hypothetical protein
MPLRIKETPITRIMVPVTTGGKSGNSLLIKGAATGANKPGVRPILIPRSTRRPRIEGVTTIGSWIRIDAQFLRRTTGSEAKADLSFCWAATYSEISLSIQRLARSHRVVRALA